MGLINNSLFSGLADRIAKQAEVYKAGLNNGLGGTKYYPRIHTGVPGDGDFEVENDLISAANTIDNNTISGTMFKNVFTTFINDLESHVLGENAPSFDSFLNTSGINTHPDFEDVFFRSKGVHLDARNTFFSEANILVASYFAAGSGSGTGFAKHLY